MNSSLDLQPGFRLATARALALASQAAYANADIYCPSTDTQVLVTEQANCTVIAFRGTSSLRDWITDAEFRFRSLPAGRVHHGFLDAMDSVLPPLIARLLPDDCDKSRIKPLVITGHSLGGALAILCAWLLQNQGLPVQGVYTFGQPRVGDRAFATAYTAVLGAKTYRLVNQNDLIPRLPGVLLGFRHAGELQFINAAGNLLSAPSLLTVLVSDALSLYAAYRQLHDVLIQDHFLQNYITALAASPLPEVEFFTEANQGNAGPKASLPSTNPSAPQAPSPAPRA